MIYFDNNATTRIAPAVADAVAECLRQRLANPASSHQLGRQSRRRLEQARDTIARCLGARVDTHPADRIVITSGATEANHLAIRGLAASRPGAVVVSSLEHPSVRGAARHLEREGREVRLIAARSDGRADIEHLKQLLSEPTAVVALMLVNNETGVIQPVAQAAQLCAAADTPLHCDAAQGAGKLDLDFNALGAATLCVNAHKLHGPVGVGALVLRGGLELPPLLEGGGQQLGIRPGTESVALAVGLAAALEHYLKDAVDHRRRLHRQRDELERRLLTHPQAVIHGLMAPRAPQTSNVSFPGLDRQELLLALDMQGLACSTGSACASGSSEPSPVLRAMNLPDDQVESSLRLSLGIDTTDEEVAAGADCILKAVAKLGLSA